MGIFQLFLFLAAITILVAFHELGHMLFAKLFGMRVESYSIGFPPSIFKKKVGDTEYCLGSIPCGGYVKISGMIDESFDKKYLNYEIKSYEFRAKSAWKRLIVILGGIIANVLLGIMILSVLTWKVNDVHMSKDEFYKNGIYANEYGEHLGFKTGDKVIKVNGEDFKRVEDIFNPKTYIGIMNQSITVERDGQNVTIQIPEDFVKKMLSKKCDDSEKVRSFISPRSPFTVISGGLLLKDLQQGDKIVKVNNRDITYCDELKTQIMANIGEEVSFTIDRNGEILCQQYVIDGRIFDHSNLEYSLVVNLTIKTEEVVHGFFESIKIGTIRAFNVVSDSVVGMKNILNGTISASDNVSGPIGMVKMFKSDISCVGFFTIVAVLSMSLALMNFLPIPALDGGHALLIILEMVFRRKIGYRILFILQCIGMALLLMLFLYTAVNDVRNFFVK